MAFDFPSGPALDQIYTSPDGAATYIFDGVAWMAGSATSTGTTDYVLKAGDTMTGYLTLNADPINPLHAATKQYTDIKALPPIGLDGQALVALTGTPTWGAPVNGGGF